MALETPAVTVVLEVVAVGETLTVLVGREQQIKALTVALVMVLVLVVLAVVVAVQMQLVLPHHFQMVETVVLVFLQASQGLLWNEPEVGAVEQEIRQGVEPPLVVAVLVVKIVDQEQTVLIIQAVAVAGILWILLAQAVQAWSSLKSRHP
jgi:hypothetical protein